MNSRQDLIKRYRQALEAPLADRKSYKDFRESVRDLETREDQFVGRTLSNTKRYWALFAAWLWDPPAYHRYFRFCAKCALPPRSNPLAPLVMRRSELSPRASQTKTARSAAVSSSYLTLYQKVRVSAGPVRSDAVALPIFRRAAVRAHQRRGTRTWPGRAVICNADDAKEL